MLKLINSKTEQEIRENLIESHKLLFKENFFGRLLNVLQVHFPNMKTAYFIGHIPEQGEDIYTILVNADIIAKIEIDRYNVNKIPIIEMVDIIDFKKRKSMIQQITLAVAMDLAKKDMELN